MTVFPGGGSLARKVTTELREPHKVAHKWWCLCVVMRFADQVFKQFDFGLRKSELDRCLWRGPANHREPEYAPVQDAEHRNQVREAVRCTKPRLLSLAARFQDLVEGFDLPAHGVPVEFLDCLGT